MDKWVTDDWMQFARNPYNIQHFRDDCSRIFQYNEIENNAVRTFCKDGKTIKQHIDGLIDLGYTAIKKTGRYTFLIHKDDSLKQYRLDDKRLTQYAEVAIYFYTIERANSMEKI